MRQLTPLKPQDTSRFGLPVSFSRDFMNTIIKKNRAKREKQTGQDCAENVQQKRD